MCVGEESLFGADKWIDRRDVCVCDDSLLGAGGGGTEKRRDLVDSPFILCKKASRSLYILIPA